MRLFGVFVLVLFKQLGGITIHRRHRLDFLIGLPDHYRHRLHFHHRPNLAVDFSPVCLDFAVSCLRNFFGVSFFLVFLLLFG